MTLSLDKRELELLIEGAVGGKYEMPDGRNFWVDAPVAQEMARRVTEVIMRKMAQP